MEDLRRELEAFREEHKFLKKTLCSAKENETYRQLLKEERPLPDGVFEYIKNETAENQQFYTVTETDLTKEEKEDLISYKKLKTLTTIKNCVVFFTVLTVFSLIAGFLIMLGT